MSLIKGKQIEADSVTASQIDTTSGTISTVNGGDVAAEGSGAGVSRRDHQHAVATGGATDGIAIGDTAAEGTSANLAREDHTHAMPAPAAPADVSKSAASTGIDTAAARADHKHDIATGNVNDVGQTNSEGTGSDLARADHVHSHGNQPLGDGLDHASATVTFNGFMSAADKLKLDSLAGGAGLDVKEIVQLAGTVADGNFALTGEQTIDGVLTSASRVLLKNQTSGIENGIYVTAAGAWTRAGDLSAGDSASGAIIAVDQGTLNLDTIWFCVTDKPGDVVGTNVLTFALQAQGSPRMNGAGLALNGNTLDIGANADGSITVNGDDIQVGVLASDAQHGVRGGGTQHALATTGPEVAGFMSGADKTKLDGIDPGAEVNHTSRQEQITAESVVGADTVLTDQLNFTPESNESVVLDLNGVRQRQGAGESWTISGTAITWLASSGNAVDLEVSDHILVTYLS